MLRRLASYPSVSAGYSSPALSHQSAGLAALLEYSAAPIIRRVLAFQLVRVELLFLLLLAIP
eukprot:7030187-Pyramimonas_sp.AAC.1